MAKVKKKVKNKRVKKSRNRVLYILVGLVAAIFIFTAGTMALMVKDEIKEEKEEPIMLESPPETVTEPHLIVEDVFFMKTAARTDLEKVNIITTVYITNDGLANAKDVKIIAWPIDEDKNLALDKAETNVKDIPTQKTSEIEFDINVPPGAKHNVDLLIFERGRLILRGSGSVVIEGSYSNTPQYETTHIMGTGNDSDYDGMSDSWEIYYGLDPYDPNDAFEDADADGMGNVDEYQTNNEPCKPHIPGDGGDGDGDGETKKEDDEQSFSLGDSSFNSVLIIIIVIVIIILITIPAIIYSSKQQNRYNQLGNTQSTSTWPQQSAQNAYPTSPGQVQAQGQPQPKRCSRCGSWVVNDVCVGCGAQYNNQSPGNDQNNNASIDNNRNKL